MADPRGVRLDKPGDIRLGRGAETPAAHGADGSALFLDKLLDAFPLMSRRWHSISARTGYASYRGKAWAKICEPIINFLMRNPKHCRQAAVSEGLIPA